MGNTRLRKGDPVIVVAGNDKGKEGKLLAIKGDRVVVQGVNLRKKHQKAQGENKKGAIVTFEAPVHVSNVQYAAHGKPVKLRARFNSENKKEIFYKTENNEEHFVRKV
jgi:large subunit ribosomal protein L24